LRHLGITMRGYRTEYGTPILTDVSVKDAIAGVVAAVRAETLREMREVVEGMPNLAVDIGRHPTLVGVGVDIVHRSDILSRLDALAQPEGTK
jgi:allophanate hydrolase subunit 1